MPFNSDDLVADSQLYVGYGSVKEVLGIGTTKIRGSAFIQGPTIIGDPAAFDTLEATVMIGPVRSIDIAQIPLSPAVSNYRKQSATATVDTTPPVYEDLDTGELIPVGDIRYVPSIFPARIPQTSDGGVACQPLENLALVVKGGAKVVENFHVAGNSITSGEVSSNCGGHILSKKKNFDIPHPTKEGWRLTHSCVEGPEAAVYFRGRLTNKNIIKLPEYWKKLVDQTTITASITPIGSHQDIIVKRVSNTEIALQSKGGMPIDCFYHIFGERKDTEKLVPEYMGSIEDYPGDNSQRSIAGYHYDTKENK